MMIAYYSMCPSNEWLPAEQLSVKTDWGTPEGEGGGVRGNPVCILRVLICFVFLLWCFCAPAVELCRVQADPAGGLSLREDLQRQWSGLQG